ncbi:hypothetical protein [Planococcus maitriensis]|uniref:Uncharacterized protein n=1 Tax=Planococcus maitriensis TaxID=221799 RepID=A0A365K778_9BACL|nr:hypothetical protein [Planococcus maitriensis]RAZ68496.1 hypothetical protein DP119_07470 [Planococcus maitriensis]
MEPLIMMLIIAAVSTLFGKDKKKDANQQKGQQTTRQQVPGAPPRSAQQKPQQAPSGGQRSFKRIEDYAKEIYGEFQSQMENDPKRAEQARQVKEQAERAKARAVEEVEKRSPAQAKQAGEPKNRPGRLSTHQKEPLKRAIAKEEEQNLFPLKENDVRKGIIMAEILQAPKSKRQKQGRHI